MMLVDKWLLGAVLGAGFAVQPIAGDDVLEPSVQNEVEHALAQAEKRLRLPEARLAATNRPPAMPVAWTNGLSRSDAAIRLVSLQKANGAWMNGTNEVTHSATLALKRLASE